MAATEAKDWLAAHPIVDHLAPILVLAAWFYFGLGYPSSEDARQGMYVTLATVSGLALASGTFVATLTYQSADTLVRELRTRFHRELKRNWTSILWSSFITALVPLAAMATDKKLTTIAFAIAIYVAALLIARFARTLYWLRLCLFVGDKGPAATAAQPPPLKLK